MSATKLILATSAILLMAAALAATNQTSDGSDATAASIAALKTNLGDPAALEIEEVRMTSAGVACVDYRVSNGQDAMVLGHAVVQDKEVLKSSSDDDRFERAWNEHCLGPRGGITGK